MARTYIDKEKAINALRRVCFLCKRFYNCTDCRIEESLVALKDLPAADVAEVKHGKWLVTDSFDHHKTPIYRCSVCRREVADSYINLHEHCLRCGAKMDGGKEE